MEHLFGLVVVLLAMVGPAPAYAGETDGGEEETAEVEPPKEADEPSDEGETPEPGQSSSQWALTASGFTEVPLQLGGELQIDAPGHLRLRGGIGYLPSSYMTVANELLVGAFDEYTEEDAALVESTVGNSLLWQAGIGFVTGDNEGFYMTAGYAAATFGGTAASGALVESSTDQEIPDRVKNRYPNREFDIGSTLHQLDLEFGVEWKFNHLSLRSGLGWSFTFASTADVEAQFGDDRARIQEQLDEIERQAEKDLNETYRSYVHPPYLSVGLGFAFH